MQDNVPALAPNVEAAKVRLAAGLYDSPEAIVAACQKVIDEYHCKVAKCDFAATGWDDESEPTSWDGISFDLSEYQGKHGIEGTVETYHEPDTMSPWTHEVDLSGIETIEVLVGMGDASLFEIDGRPDCLTIDGHGEIYPSETIVQRGPYIVMVIDWEVA